MERLIDRAILFVLCLVVLIASPVYGASVGALLGAIICVSINEVFNNKIVDYAIAIIWIIASFFVHELAYFYPIMVYMLSIKNGYLLIVLGQLITVTMYPISNIYYIICSIAFSGLAIVMQQRSTKLVNLRERIGQMRDDSAEYTLLAEEKNREIIRNQNNEIYTATLRERNRIAREIHDNVGHLLSRAILMVGAIKSSNDSPMITELDGTLNSAMNSIRESVHDLRDESVDLHETLKQMVEQFNYCKCNLIYDASDAVPGNIKYSIIAIAKESLNNVIKHSGADAVDIHFTEHPGIYQLVIKDNGRGQTFAADERGIGLENIKSRVKTLDGNVTFKSENGFRVFVTVPKK